MNTFNTYEIILICPFCEAESRLGFLQAESTYEAKQKAEIRWPDARYEEMYARIQQEQCSTSTVVQEVA